MRSGQVELDAVEISDLRAVEHRQIAGFANLLDHAANDLVADDAARLIAQDGKGERRRARRQLIVASVRRSLHEARGFKRAEPAMHGGFWNARAIGELRQ